MSGMAGLGESAGSGIAEFFGAEEGGAISDAAGFAGSMLMSPMGTLMNSDVGESIGSGISSVASGVSDFVGGWFD